MSSNLYTSETTNPSSSSTQGPITFTSAIHSSRGHPLIGTVLTLPSPTIAQLTALTPGDFIMIDMEHTPLPIETVTQMVSAYTAAARPKVKFPLIRIPSHGVEWVKWALDSGAAGLIIPMVNNAGEMKAILDKRLYPPAGRRSFGPLLAQFAAPTVEGVHDGTGAYFARAKQGEIAILAMIESAEGVANAEAILCLPGVDGTFVGPADLRLSLGLPPAVDGTEEEFKTAMATVVKAAKKHGKVVGTMGMGEKVAQRRTAEGFDFLLSTFDNGDMVAGMTRELEAARKGAVLGYGLYE